MSQNYLNVDKPQTKSGLAKKLIASLLLGIAAAIVVITGIQIYLTIDRGHVLLREDLSQTAHMASTALGDALWDLNKTQANFIIDGFLRGKNIYGILVLDDNGREYAKLGSIIGSNTQFECVKEQRVAGNIVSQNPKPCLTDLSLIIEHREAIFYNKKPIGTVVIFSDKDIVISNMTPLIIVAIIGAVLILIILCFIAWITIERGAGKPLRNFADLIRKSQSTQGLVDLKIPATITSRNDELGELGEAFEDIVNHVKIYQAHLEDMVEDRTAKLNVANEAKTTFLSKMSHEIRTPINGVLGLSELLLLKELPADYRISVEMIHSSANLLLNLVNDILDLSKIEAGKMLIEYLPINIQQVIEEIVPMFLVHPKSIDIKLITAIDDNIPEYLSGDALRIKQVLINLLNNAYKFTSRGSIKLTVTVNQTYDHTALISISVTDSGVGIPSNLIDNLFAPFNQGDISTTRKYGGTGLGLTICRQLVEMMGGTIGITSEVNVGSCFYFSLPMTIVEHETIVTTATADKKSVAHTEPSAEISVLVAEDNLVNQMVVKGMLQSLGISPVIAADGKQAIDKFSEATKPFDLILMDCEMPVIDGWQATHIIKHLQDSRSESKKAIIIGLSAHAIEGIMSKALAAGMDDYLTKPLTIAALTAALKKHGIIE